MFVKNELLESGTAKILMALNNKKLYKSQIAKKTNMTGSYVMKLVDKIIKEGFMSRKEEGRCVFITLTPKGKKISDKLCELRSLLRKQEKV